jgi:hypothetical protein
MNAATSAKPAPAVTGNRLQRDDRLGRLISSEAKSPLPQAQVFLPSVDRFDYGNVLPELATRLRAQAERIRGRIRKSTEEIIDIGRDLLAVKDELERGAFICWVETEVGINRRTAQAYISAVKLYEKSATVALFPPATVYRLAAKSAPAEVVETVIAKADAGEIVPDVVVQGMLSDAHARHRREVRQKRKASIRSASRRRREQQSNYQSELQEQKAKAQAIAIDLLRVVGLATVRKILTATEDIYVRLALQHEIDRCSAEARP